MSADDDKVLEEYLAGDSELSRRYRETGKEAGPPPHIDERIRAAARGEVNARPARRERGRPAWTGPLAAAAVMVLAVGVTFHMARDPGTVSREASPPPVHDEAGKQSGQPESSAGSGVRGARSLEYAPDPGRASATDPSVRKESARTSAPDGQALKPDEAPEPRAWLSRIRELVAQGDAQAARDQLRRFVERYPEHEIPAELAALLEGGDAGAGAE